MKGYQDPLVLTLNIYRLQNILNRTKPELSACPSKSIDVIVPFPIEIYAPVHSSLEHLKGNMWYDD